MGSLTSSLYNISPVFFQNLAVSLFGYTWRKRRFGGIYEEELKAFRNREGFSPMQWYDYQTISLRKVLLHAFDTVPFYEKRLREVGLARTRLEKLQIDSINLLPRLAKEELRQFGKSTLVSSKREPKGQFFSSSGSTGTPMQILFSEAMHQRWSAGFEARIRNWAGVDRFLPRGMIGGRRVVAEGNAKPPYYRYNIFEKQTYFSAYHISSETARDYLEGMIKHNVQYMTGYAMSNFFLARFIEESGLQAPQLRAVITSSEKLTGEMRDAFQRVYGCKSYDSWSGVEACGLVSECEHGSLHISPDIGIIELLDENGSPVKPGEVGEVVCTSLINFDQPLIRYRIGDLMRLGSGSCGCGRSMPIIEEIVGRVEDVVIGRDGREMVRFHGIFVDLPNLIEAQIIQETLDDFSIKFVTNGHFTDGEKELIRKRMQSQLGDINLELIEVKQIPRNQNGKFPAVVSKVKRENSFRK